jgi:hypothetical protein
MRSFSYVDDVLDDLVPPVVARYREAGTLTWSLLHRIEGEVLEEALASGQLSAATVKMIRSIGRRHLSGMKSCPLCSGRLRTPGTACIRYVAWIVVVQHEWPQRP